MSEYELERLRQALEYIQDVCDYHDVDAQFELEWIFDGYYVNVWVDRGTIKAAEHLSSAGDFEDVWAWLAKHYINVDWSDQEF